LPISADSLAEHLAVFLQEKKCSFDAEWAIGLANHRKDEEEIPWKNLNLNLSVAFYFLHRLKKTRVYSKKVSFIYKRFSRKLGSDCISRKV